MGDNALTGLDPDELDIGDAPRIIWILVRDAINLLWKDNPKKHDIGLLAQSIRENGMRDPAAYDSALGAFAYGNGRVEACWFLEQQAKPGDAPPPGIARQKETGYWAIPVVVGVDAESELLAKRFAIDHNNLTMSGGDFAAWDFTQMWDEGPYLEALRELALAEVETIALDADDIAGLLAEKAYGEYDEAEPLPETEILGEGEERLRIILVFEDEDARRECLETLGAANPDDPKIIWLYATLRGD